MSTLLADRKVRRFTVDEYYQMWDTGILARDRRYELIEGEILEMMPLGPEHASNTDIVAAKFKADLPKEFRAREEKPIHLSDLSEPQPDVAVVPFREDNYSKAHPTPKEVLLVIEVSLSSLNYDLSEKLETYATAGIPEYWVINLSDRKIHVFTQPSGAKYTHEAVFQGIDELKPTKIPGFGVKTSELFV